MSAIVKRIYLMEVCLLVVAVMVIAAPRISQAKAAGSRVEILPPIDSYAKINDVNIQQEGRDLLISGKIIKTGHLFTSYTGHVDVAVIGRDGKTSKVGTAEYHAFPSRNRTSIFKVRLPGVSGDGAEIRLMFHPEDEIGAGHSYSLCMLQSKGAIASSCR